MKNLYTEEQINWLRENVDNYFYEDLTKTFNQVFLENRSKSSIYNVLKHNQIKKTQFIKDKTVNLKKFEKKYTEEQINWVKENRCCVKNLNELREKFNKKFNMNLTETTFYSLTKNYKINNPKYLKKHYFNSDELTWIKNNIDNYIGDKHFYTDRFCKDFEKKFGFSLDRRTLWSKLNYHGIKKPKSNPNHFMYPIGNEKKWGNYTYVKVDDRAQTFEFGTRENQLHNYRRKTNLMYEKYHNIKLNDDEDIVIQLDENPNNYSKENLYLINKKALHIYVGSKYKNENLETKLNALKVSEIYALIKEMEKNEN